MTTEILPPELEAEVAAHRRAVAKMKRAVAGNAGETKRLVKVMREANPHIRAGQMADRLGVSRERIAQVLRALDLPRRVEGEARGGLRST